jgi:transposase-like protein
MSQSLAILNRIVSTSRWSEREAREVIAALAASKLNPAEFARRHSIQVQRIYNWQRRLASTGTEFTRSRPTFVEVDASAASGPVRAARYELVTSHGDALRIDGPIDAPAIRTLLGILHEARGC